MSRQEEFTQSEIRGLKTVFAAWQRKELGKRGPIGPDGPTGPQGPDGPAGVSGGSIPTGVICMWSGTVATIPTGWVLCDGANSTPDLRDKFVIGAKQDDAGVAKTNVTGSLTQSGGAATHTHAYGTLANSSDSAGTPAGTVSQPTFSGTVGQSTSSDSAGTPAGTVSQPTFSGTVGQSTSSDSAGTPAGTIAWPAGVPTLSGNTANEAAHTHTYTDVPNHVHTLATGTGASGNFSQVIGVVDTSSGGTGATPTQTALGTRSGNPVSGVTTGTTSAGSSHNHGAGTLAVAWPAGVPTLSGSALSNHSHTYTAAGTVSQPSFTGSALGNHSHTITATGTVSQPTFTGSALATHTHTISGDTASGSSLGPYYALAFIMKVDE